ncbi:hypothetical protein CANMA_001957 [Candida margitis]|uniref:uncharacterized protein n=1 Tax=Candida margitis TaxID=1775924 RepID=UPI0022267B8B|nr:uncharacterized protein CANMA_001957 [Candida margitis]KAI5968961.1 hypothetical protein CANMA_001957 [Candida margitis]
MSRKRQFEEDSSPLCTFPSSPNAYSTSSSSQGLVNSSPNAPTTTSTCYTLDHIFHFSSQFQTFDAFSSPVAKRVQLSKVHTEVHQKTIRMMMDASVQLQRQEQQQQQQQFVDSTRDGELMKDMNECNDGTENLKENKCTYFQQPYW